jgi:hypothetical protein
VTQIRLSESTTLKRFTKSNMEICADFLVLLLGQASEPTELSGLRLFWTSPLLIGTCVPGAAVQISVGNSHQVYVTTSSHDVFRWHGSDWAHVDGIKLKRVAVSADGAVAGVTDSDDIMFFDGAKWHNIPGKLSEVDVKGRTFGWGELVSTWWIVCQPFLHVRI